MGPLPPEVALLDPKVQILDAAVLAPCGWIVDVWLPSLLLGLLAVQTARLWWLGSAAARRLRVNVARGRRGERTAEALLKRAGFRILGRQVQGSWEIVAAGQPIAIELSPDFLVRRKGHTYVADAKTGKAARLTHAGTRRQLLEYRHAFDVDGVLLVDAERGEIHEVVFPSARSAPKRAWLPLVLVLGSVALLVYWLSQRA